MRSHARAERREVNSARKRPGGVRWFLSILGPGLISGAADDDPAGIVTYSQAGARYGYSLLWVSVLQAPLLSAVQLMCARIGIATRKNIVEVVAAHYPRWLLWSVCVLLLFANTVNVAADLDGVAAALELLTNVRALVYVPFVAMLLIGLMIFGSYRTVRGILKWTTLSLFAYVVAAILAHPDWGAVLERSIVPVWRNDPDYATMFVALFGTTIAPYLFVWQSAEEVEELESEARARAVVPLGRKLRSAAIDTIFGMTASQVIDFAIMLAAAATVGRSGGQQMQTARDVAHALQPIGALGITMFTVGMIGTVMLAIPTLLGASAYALTVAIGQPSSLEARPTRAKAFYAVLTAGAVVGVLLAFLGVSPVRLLFASAVVNGMLAPPLLLLILIMANTRRVMKEHVNDWALNLLGGLTTALMSLGAGWLAIQWSAQQLPH